MRALVARVARFSNLQGLVTLKLTLGRVTLHTVVHHTSTSTYKPNFIEIEETFCGRTYVRTYVRTCTYVQADGHLRPTLLKIGHTNLNMPSMGYSVIPRLTVDIDYLCA